MNIDTVGLDSLNSTPTKETKTEDGGAKLDKDDFLKLLMTSLKYQDPMSPMENTEMMAQMAQLTTVEQITNMSKTIEKLSDALTGSKVQQGASFLGKNVKATDGAGQEISGMVDKVQVQDDVIQLLVQNKTIHIGQVKEVSL